MRSYAAGGKSPSEYEGISWSASKGRSSGDRGLPASLTECAHMLAVTRMTKMDGTTVLSAGDPFADRYL